MYKWDVVGQQNDTIIFYLKIFFPIKVQYSYKNDELVTLTKFLILIKIH